MVDEGAVVEEADVLWLPSLVAYEVTHVVLSPVVAYGVDDDGALGHAELGDELRADACHEGAADVEVLDECTLAVQVVAEHLADVLDVGDDAHLLGGGSLGL